MLTRGLGKTPRLQAGGLSARKDCKLAAPIAARGGARYAPDTISGMLKAVCA